MASGSGQNVDAKTIKVYIKDAEDEKLIEGKYWTRKEKKQWSAALFGGCMVLYTCRTVMPLCIVQMSQEMKWDKAEAGTVLSCFFWGYTMTQLLGGYLSDRIGGEIVLPIAATFWSLVTFCTPMLTYITTDKQLTFYIIVSSRVVLGLCQESNKCLALFNFKHLQGFPGDGAFPRDNIIWTCPGFHFPGFTSLLSRKVLESERSFTYAFVSSGAHLGTLICGSVGSILLESYGWQSVFTFAGLCGISWILLLNYSLLKHHRRKEEILALSDNVILVTKSTKVQEPVPWLTLFAKPAFWSLLVGHFCENNAFYILLSWMPTYFHENFPSAKGWIFNVVPWVVTIPSTMFGGWLADRMISSGYSVTYVRKFMETIALCGTATCLVAISYTSSFPAALFCMALAVCCCGFHNSGILVNPQDIAPRHAGSVFGIMNMAGAVPGFVGVYIAGHILEATKSWTAVFNQTATVCVSGWVVYVLFGTGKKIV